MERILIVDDIEENLDLLRVVLEGHGYEVDQARNGIEALPRVMENIPDMIISDILMPEMDGFTFCKIVKKNEQLKHILFIFYTATYTDPRDEKLAFDLGADAFITKPAEPKVFLKQVEKILLAAHNGSITPRQNPVAGEDVVLKEYNEALVRKLEHKKLGLEQANRTLEAEIEVRKEAEKALRDSEERYRSLFEHSMDAVFLTEPEGSCILKANPEACRIFGRNEEEILRTGRDGLMDTSDPRLADAIEERARTGMFQGELTALRKDGTPFPCEVSSVLFSDKSGKLRTSMILRDITERKRAEEALLSALREKEALLKEIHHRVRNNMQIVNSLISLQLNFDITSLTPEKLMTVAMEMQNRIQSMALVHDMLYKSKSFAKINLKEYMHSLVESLFITYGVKPGQVIPVIDIADIPLSITTAIPLGLIITELLTNALKYAFPSGKSGEIRITMSVDDGGGCTLTVRDTGIGLPENFDIKAEGSFGMHVVLILIGQLDASIAAGNDNGAVFTVLFREINGKDTPVLIDR